jgi:hypothetical protein
VNNVVSLSNLEFSLTNLNGNTVQTASGQTTSQERTKTEGEVSQTKISKIRLEDNYMPNQDSSDSLNFESGQKMESAKRTAKFQTIEEPIIDIADQEQSILSPLISESAQKKETKF